MKPKATKKGKAARRKKGTNSMIPFEQVQALIDMLEERGLEEFKLERGDLRIHIRRRGKGALAPVLEDYAEPGSEGAAAEAGGAEAAQAAGAGPELAAEGTHVVKSPIVGTFYASPQPDAPPFVKLGDVVEVGQVLCIIEAMKLMNEIETDEGGEIVRIYVENAQPVEYGEPLFAIRPRQKK